MDLSVVYRHASTSATVSSPDSQWLLTIHQDRLILRSSETMEMKRSWRCSAIESAAKENVPPPRPPSSKGKAPELAEKQKVVKLTSSGFSPDGRHVLAVDVALSTIWVYGLDEEEEEEAARIVCGVEGCRGARFLGNDSVAVWSDFGVRKFLYFANDF